MHWWWNLLFLFVMVHLAEGHFSESLCISFFFLDQRWLVKKQPCFLFSVAIHQRPESIHRLSYIWLIYWRRITGRKSNYFVFIKLLLSSETLSITIFPFAIERCQFYGILIFYNMIIIYKKKFTRGHLLCRCHLDFFFQKKLRSLNTKISFVN